MRKPSPVFFRHFASEWIVFVSISVILALLLAYHQYTTHRFTLAQEKWQLIRSATTSEYVIGQQIERISITLDKIRLMLAPDWEKQDTNHQLLDERLELLSSAMPSVQAVTLVDKDGQAIASSTQQVIGKSFAYRDYFSLAKEAPDKETLFVSPPFEGIYGDWLIAFSKAILDEKGEFSGVVFILLNAQEYKQSLNVLRPTEDTWAMLAHSDGVLFAWEPEAIAVTGENLAKPGTLFAQHLESGSRASFFSEAVVADNKSSLMAIRSISPDNLNMNNPLILGVARGTDELYQALQRTYGYNG